jgi:hypothetical protein
VKNQSKIGEVMSTELELISSKVDNLSLDELLVLEKLIALKLKHKIETEKTVEAILAKFFLPKPTNEQIENELAQIFPPEVRAQMGTTDFSKFANLAKPISEMINEDREDRKIRIFKQ